MFARFGGAGARVVVADVAADQGRETVDLMLATHWRQSDGNGESEYGESKGRNTVHASDSVASAEREVKLFFGVAALSH